MDRYLSSGKYRPQMLHAHELRIQLPASERAFLFAEKVRTLMLGEEDRSVSGPGRAEVQNQRQQSVMLGTTGTPEPNMAPSPRSTSRDEEEKGRLEVGSDEGLISRYVKILEIYGKVVKWSCAGGRRYDPSSKQQTKQADNSVELRNTHPGTNGANSTSCVACVRSSRPVCLVNKRSLRRTHKHISA